jgi:hypothetical protein
LRDGQGNGNDLQDDGQPQRRPDGAVAEPSLRERGARLEAAVEDMEELRQSPEVLSV